MNERSLGTLVFATQLVAPDDPVLGFLIPQLRALADRFDRLVVIANEVVAVPEDLDAEVISLGKEQGAGRARRLMRYEAVLFPHLRRKPVTLLAHMAPRYLNSAAPLTRLLGVPTLLWYAHPAWNGPVRRAERRASAVITTTPGTYPHPGPKVRAIGQAIDLERFPATPVPTARPRQLLAAGRTSAVKGYAPMLRGLALARSRGADIELTIVGPATNDAERQHARELAALVDELQLGGAARLHAGVPHTEVAAMLRQSTALVNLTAVGNGDKAVLEAMASARPVIATDGAFADLFDGLPLRLTGSAEVEDVAERMAALAAAPDATLDDIGRVLRQRVEQHHSLSSWVDAIADLVRELQAPPARERR